MRTQTFGIEIETTGLGRQRTAEVIAKFFGTTAQYVGAHLDDWKIPMPDGRRWTVESDGSVTDPSAEVVSPVCHWEDIEMIQQVVRALRKAGAKVDSTCGIHIHVGLGEHTPRTLRNLVNIVNAKEDLLTQALGIVYRMIMALKRMIDSGCQLTEPDAVKAGRLRYQETNSTVVTFFEDCMIPITAADKNRRCTAMKVYSAYQGWCRDNHRGYAKTAREFKEELAAHLGKTAKELTIRRKEGMVYREYTLLPDIIAHYTRGTAYCDSVEEEFLN